MPERKWTSAQKSAIELEGGSLLVSAAAGSGKTAVLVERIIRKITREDSPCDADRLLVVTYTNAAAAEMKERVGRRLDELSAQNPDDANLARQRMLLQSAHISTIHSFCLELIRGHFQELDIPPDFRIADENEMKLLRGETLQKIIEEKYERDAGLPPSPGGKPFVELAETLGSVRDDSRLVDTVLRLYDFVRSLHDASGWLDEKLKMYDGAGDLPQTLWGRSALGYAAGMLREAEEIQKRALEQIGSDERMGKAYAPQYREDLDFLHRALELASAGRWDELYETVNGYRFPALGQLRKFEDEELKNAVKGARDRVKGIVRDLCSGILACNTRQLEEDLCRMRPMVKALFETVSELDRRLFEEKLARSMLDFGDLEQLALRLLTEKKDGALVPTAAAKEIAKQFDEILIDEYQDTNLVQDAIFRAVSRNGENLFMVGDVKQSIYRFRQAMPEIFLSKKECFSPCDGNHFPAKIILGNNFRSRAGVTGAVNFIFRQLMSKELGEIEYGAEEELVPSASYPERGESDFELHLVDTGTYEGTDDGETLEARYIAKLIREMVESGSTVFSDGVLRPVTWGDFCILLRSTSRRAEKYMREISLCGVPVWAEIAGGYLGSYEVAVMLSLLRILDNPMQDVPLLSVLMFPMFGFLPDDVAKIRIRQRKGALYTALVNYAKENGGKYAKFLETLGNLRRVAAVLPADRLILKIYDETGFLYFCEAMPGGEKRRANLRLLLDYARNYEAAGYKGLSGFIRFIDRLSESKGDLAPASAVSESANVVRIMSIHKSKGLEFPVCILAGCSKAFNLTDVRQNAMFSPFYGFGCMLRDKTLDFRYTTLPREVVKNEIVKSTLSEEMRVLYVALTRAKDRLIVVGTVPKPENALSRAAGLLDGRVLSPFRAARSQSFMEWILACALRHPSCGELRRLAGIPAGETIEDPFPWEIVVSEPPDASLETAGEPPAREMEDTAVCSAVIEQRLAYRYPYAALSGIPSKLSVTEIAERHERAPARSVRPAFLRETKLTGAEAGTAMHSFMQYAEFSKLGDAESIRSEIERLVRMKYILPAEGEAVGVSRVARFVETPLFQRLLKADKIWREFRFNIEMPVCALYGEHPDITEEPIVVQGMADIVFAENGRFCIVDYKTDYTRESAELVQKYSKQLEIYEKAVESIMGGPVAEKHIYSFHLGEDILL